MIVDSGHLTYCSNIHAGESWTAHFAALKHNFSLIKKQVSPDKPMAIGLRLSNQASLELTDGKQLQEFRQWLQENQAYVFTMNGFPYGEFHHAQVKDMVHAPDWTTENRLEYTIRLFGILEKLLPEGMEGGISTSPLSYRHWFKNDQELKEAKEKALGNILSVIEELIIIRQEKGIVMHLDIEPEPDGLLETGREFIQWFEEDVLPEGKKRLAKQFAITVDEAELLLKDHLNLCYDICHFAVGYEPHAEILKELDEKGIKVGKIQISSALKGRMPADLKERSEVVKAFSAFDEPGYLHQVAAASARGIIRYRDLPEALEDADNEAVQEWRAHFHVPVFTKEFGLLSSTQNDIEEVLRIHKKKPFTHHLEVETYTWEVLPQSLKLPIDQSIVRELNWVKELL